MEVPEYDRVWKLEDLDQGDSLADEKDKLVVQIPLDVESTKAHKPI